MAGSKPRLSVKAESLDELKGIPEVSDRESEGVPIGGDLHDYRQQHQINTLQSAQAELSERVDLHTLRKIYSGRLFILVVFWVATVWGALLLQGFSGLPWWPFYVFQLSDAVLIAYITSTTASVLGLFGIAAYWMFGGKKSTAKATKES